MKSRKPLVKKSKKKVVRKPKKKVATKSKKKIVRKPKKKVVTNKRKQTKPKPPRSFGKKVFKGLTKKENDRLRRLARDLATAKVELARLRKIKRRKPKPKPKSQPKDKTASEKAKLLKRNVHFLKHRESDIQAINDSLSEINGQKIKIALGNSLDRMSRLSQLEEQSIKLRRQRYRMTRPYFSEKLIEFREGHVNGIDSFIHACLSIGMSEREAYTLWYSPK